jgi:hypothetical protein
MQFGKLAILAGLAASVSAWANETWVTTTVDVLTTVCPYATSMTFNGVTYTATAHETITITNCPCTVSYKPTVTPVVPVSTPAYHNTTAPKTTAPHTPVGTVTPVTTAKPTFTGAANRAVVGSAAGLAGLLGAAAYFL